MALARFDPFRVEVPTSLGTIAAIDTGTGDPMLFVHGVGTNGHLWGGVVDALAPERRCIAIDLPGHGRSPVGDDQDLTLGGIADLVEAFCAAADLDTIDLVAHDTGGAIAQIFAARHPERLRTLTLTNCETHDNVPPPAFAPTVDLARSGELAPGAAALLADIPAARAIVFAMGYEDPEHLDDERTAISSSLSSAARPAPSRSNASSPVWSRVTCSLPSRRCATSTCRHSSCGAPATSSSTSTGRTGSATRSPASSTS